MMTICEEGHDPIVYQEKPRGTYPMKCPLCVAIDEATAAEARGKLVVALIPFRCRGAWWHEAVLWRSTEIRCVRKRIHFLRPDGSRAEYGAGHDSCIVIWKPGHLGNPRIRSWDQGKPAAPSVAA